MPEPEMTTRYLLRDVADEIRSPEGPGEVTKAYNQALIEEFRANDGRLSGGLERADFMLLTTTGAKSGKERTIPLAFIERDAKRYIVASKGGAATSPAWYFNLVANPVVTAEYDSTPIECDAVVLAGQERDEVFAHIASVQPTFAGYQERTERLIPVIELRPR